MSIRIAGQVVASAGSLTAHNHDAEAHPEIRALIEQGGGGTGPAEGAYTKDNLVGGTDIEFAKEVVGSGQIDDDTILMLHLDGSAEDSSPHKGKLSIGDASSWTYGEGKFGQMALSGGVINIADDNNTLFNAIDKITVDYTTFFSANATSPSMVRVLTRGGADVYVYAYYWRGKLLEAYINGATTAIDTTNIELEQFLQISYEISEGKVVLFVNGNPVLTKKDSNIKMGTGLSGMQVLPPTNGNAGLEEVRVSKCLRYNGQPFEIPTQPYSPATETGRTLVSYVGGTSKGAYTKENLIGGKGVEIVPEATGGGKDEHTIALWSFEDSLSDSINNLSFYTSSDVNAGFETGKFGKSLRSVRGGVSGSVLLSDRLFNDINFKDKDFTVDVWHDAKFGGFFVATGSNSSSAAYNGFSVNFDTSYNKISVKINNVEKASVSYSFSQGENYWHKAIQKEGNTLTAYVKGEPLLSYTLTEADKALCTYNGFYISGGPRVDELRVSNVARYSGKFTPPTEPYSVPVYTGRSTIEAEGKADTDLGNIPANYDYVVESKYPTENDTSWYRVYKSGWVEQGGRVSSSAENASLTVTLLKPMKNNRYCVQRTSASTSTTAATFRSFGITGITATTFNVYITDTLSPTYWYVCGQGA